MKKVAKKMIKNKKKYLNDIFVLRNKINNLINSEEYKKILEIYNLNNINK